MPTQTSEEYHRTGNFYGTLAYGSVVLTSFAGFFAPQRYYGEAGLVPLVFALGAIYTALGILVGNYIGEKGRLGHAIYYVVQCALLTVIITLSPARGFMGILALPLVSQAIFDVRASAAVLIGLYLFGLNIAVWAVPYGWGGAARAVMSYFAAFAFTIVFTIMTKKAVFSREREAKLRAEVEAANQLLRQQAAQMEELATTRERNRLAREIHDGVGHYLTVVKTQLDAASALLPAQPERAREAVTTAAKLAGDALDDVRRSVGALRTVTSRCSLPQAVRTLADESGLPLKLEVSGTVRPLAPAIEHALFRAIQEGLTNVRKHAAGSAAQVTLDYTSVGSVTVIVCDGGPGATAVNTGGYGLVGIRERIEVLGGRVASGNRRTGGFELRIEVPA